MRAKSIAILTVTLAGPACGSDATETTLPPARGSHGITQGGPQDIARFRAIVEAGEIPSPDTLDDVGFFAEHALDLPPADCGADVCTHPMLAVAPRFDGGNWTMSFVAMNTPIDPATVARPPVHVVLAVERTYRVLGGVPWAELATAANQLLGALRPEDRVSVVVFHERAELVAHGEPPGSTALADAVNGTGALPLSQDAAIYEGLARSGQALDDLEGFDGARRIVLLTAGAAGAGITDPARIVALGEGLARSGIALSVVGVGADYDDRLPIALGEIGAGSYAYAEDAADLGDILAAEAETTLVPIALDWQMTIEAAPGYRVGRVYGARRIRTEPGRAALASPALFVGQRTGAHDVSGGRRGGGGGLFVELLADRSSGIAPNAPAFTFRSTYRSLSGEIVTSDVAVVNPLPPGQNPADNWPVFSDPERGKAFMMLNLYLALRSSVQFHDAGDCARAMGVIDMMQPALTEWQRRFTDPDVEADWELLTMLRQNLETACAIEPVQPQYFAGSCFSS